LENRPLENKEFILKRRGGDCFWAEVSTSVLRDSGGKPIGLVSVQRDISGRKQIEEELEANRLLIRKIINTMPAFVSYIDANGYFSISNSRFEDIFGIKLARPLKGAHFTQIMPLFMLAKHQELMRICMETGAIQHFEELLPTGQHANQSIYGLYSPFYTNNVIEGIVLVVLDITNQKNTEKQLAASEQKLRESNELKDKMFSIIGHDLRGPIGNLANTLDILAEEDGFFDQNSRKRMIFLLRQSAGAALNLLENLLTWALSQRSNLSYFPSNVQINSLVRENYALLKTVANKKEIELLSHVPDDVFAYIDENLITTVLRNLISNAIKFTNPGGWVEVNASIRNLMVEVIVRDNGVGISEENLFQILHKKSHLTTYGTSNEKGSGLGLMLCQELIAKNNGQLQIISKQGEGSSFIISLPCVQS
jgi:PAS domain S-box-containing protein